MTRIAMIPARMGSQRLPQKNLAKVNGVALIRLAIRKCIEADVFNEIWVNSEHADFGVIAKEEGVKFHQRPEELGNNNATSEEFVNEFLNAHDCTSLFQVHSIAPLLTAEEVRSFVTDMDTQETDVHLSVIDENLECLFKGQPINFTLSEKTNSQDLIPINRIVWAITGWKKDVFLAAANSGECATYTGKIGTTSVNRMAGHVIKTQEDLDIAQALYSIVHKRAEQA